MVWPFVRSGRATCPTCTIAMIVHENQTQSIEFQELSRFYHVTWILYEHFDIKKHLYYPDVYTNKARWYLLDIYLSSLDAQNASFDNVFISDARDVLFQTNVFQQMETRGKGLYVFAEDEKAPIETIKSISGRLLACFGDDTFSRLAKKPNLCAGTTLGSWAAVRLYVTAMQTYISNNKVSLCTVIPYDQHFHNYIIYIIGFSNQITVHHISHETGFIATVSHSRTVMRNRFGQVLNANGHPYAVIHQYDRFMDLFLQYSREFQLVEHGVFSKRH